MPQTIQNQTFKFDVLIWKSYASKVENYVFVITLNYNSDGIFSQFNLSTIAFIFRGEQKWALKCLTTTIHQQ
jgi:hypothetical protein